MNHAAHNSSISTALRPIWSTKSLSLKNLSFFNSQQKSISLHYVDKMTSSADTEAKPPPSPTLLSTPEEAEVGDAVVITVKDEEGSGSGKGSRAAVAAAAAAEEEEEEKVCRICHLSPDRTVEEGSELILIGCGCKNELGAAHRHCAETWFRLKGNRCCEICGLNAKNITGDQDESFIEEWHDNREPISSVHRNTPERVGCWRGQPFCNFLMACLVIAFILPWFFRVNMF